MPRYDERSGPTRLYVGHISSRTRTRDLEELFGKYGRIRDVDMKQDFAFVDFFDSRDADDARHYLNGRNFDGNRIAVEFAKRGPRGAGGVREYVGRGPTPGTGRCYNCGHDGHWARDCKAGDWKNKCYRCGQRGHIERDCHSSPRWWSHSHTTSISLNCIWLYRVVNDLFCDVIYACLDREIDFAIQCGALFLAWWLYVRMLALREPRSMALYWQGMYIVIYCRRNRSASRSRSRSPVPARRRSRSRSYSRSPRKERGVSPGSEQKRRMGSHSGSPSPRRDDENRSRSPASNGQNAGGRGDASRSASRSPRSASRSPRSVSRSPRRSVSGSPRRSVSRSPRRSASQSPRRSASQSPVRDTEVQDDASHARNGNHSPSQSGQSPAQSGD